jgi:hypothetical protein
MKIMKLKHAKRIIRRAYARRGNCFSWETSAGKFPGEQAAENRLMMAGISYAPTRTGRTGNGLAGFPDCIGDMVSA